MIIQTKLLQDSCKKILDAVDSNASLKLSETLELEVRNQILYLNVTNKEYYVAVKIPLGTDVDFHAVVDAKLFLTLISKITTTDVELNVNGNVLVVKANGNYKIPLIQDETGAVVTLPRIEIDNVTNDFYIKNEVLQSIYKYNAKELLKSGCVRPVQKLFYVDENGALTFTNGACVNSFKLEQPVTLYLTEKIIKLFKLFKGDVHFFIGQDVIEGTNSIMTKVAFTDGVVSLVSLLNIDPSLTNTFPVKAIRALSDSTYSYTVTLDKTSLLEAITRLSLFENKNVGSYTYLSFGADEVTLCDSKKINTEVVGYCGTTLELEENYVALFDTQDLKLTLETCEETHINLSFGTHRAVVISRGNIKNIVPECEK